MATSRMGGVLEHLRAAALRGDSVGVTDGQLLETYITAGDGAALEALVRRHGPMVWGVCRRLLGHEQDAEDAFQATFLVLVRKAASVRPREMVANWLYGVASRTASKARTMAARKRAREREVDEAFLTKGEDRPSDLQLAVEEEVARLPDKYRVVVLLCDLEGKTRKEAARQIGWPEGTVAGRLARARAMLARRLVRRGLAGTAGALVGVLSPNLAACVPASLVSTTIGALRRAAAGQVAGSVAGPALALAECAGPSMRPWGRVLVAAVLLLPLGGGALLSLHPKAPPDRPPLAVAAPAEERQPPVENARAGPPAPPPLDLHALLRLHLRQFHALLVKWHGPVRENR